MDSQLTPTVTVVAPAGDPADVKPPAPTDAEPLPPIAPLPEPSQEVLDKPRDDAPAGNTSPTGEAWDPAVHEDPPRLAARGSWARRRGGARAGTRSTTGHAHAPRGATQAIGPETLTPEQTALKIEQTGAMCAGLVFMTGEMLVGPCMKPDAEEKAGITEAFKECCRAYDILEIPPWLGLAGALSIYGVRRWNHPDVVAMRTGAPDKPPAP